MERGSSLQKRKWEEDGDDVFEVKLRRLEEEDDVGIDIRKASPSLHLPSLRTPIRNCIPSYFVPKKISDQRGKKKSNSNQNQNQNNNKDGTSHDLICDCCYNHDPSRFFQDTQNCPVCKDCGVVKVSEVTYCDELQESQTKNKQCYKRRSYLSERLRQFSDSEPRIPEPDLQTIRYTYARLREAFNQDHPLFKKSASKREKYIKRLVGSFTVREEDTTKQHIKALLDFIDNTMENNIGIIKKKDGEKLPSFKKKYLERWAQIKKYFCGDHYYYNCLVTKPSTRVLDLLFKIATLVTLIYDNKNEREFILDTNRYALIREEEDEEFLAEAAIHRPKGEEEQEQEQEEEKEGCCFKKKKETLPPPFWLLDKYLEDPEMKTKKKNMPSIDLLFLMILFADGEDTLEVHGWYFVKKIMHEYTFHLPELEPNKTVPETIEERKKRRDTKFNALRRDFLTLKKILTHINQDYKASLDNIPEFASEWIETPKNIAQLVKITARNKDLYQFTEKK